jgi:hypothetical protein
MNITQLKMLVDLGVHGTIPFMLSAETSGYQELSLKGLVRISDSVRVDIKQAQLTNEGRFVLEKIMHDITHKKYQSNEVELNALRA